MALELISEEGQEFRNKDIKMYRNNMLENLELKILKNYKINK